MNETMLFPGKILPNTIGFDRFFDILEKLEIDTSKKSTYPPYSIAKVTDNIYVIEVAVAGFSKENINIEIHNNSLVISGIFPKEREQKSYIHKGISTKDFLHKFSIVDNCVVKVATLTDGILRVSLEVITPQEKLPKKIPIMSMDS